MNTPPDAAASSPPDATPIERLRLISAKTVMMMTSLSRTSLLRMEASGDFPERVHLTRDRYAWLESEVCDWLQARISARRLKKSPR